MPTGVELLKEMREKGIEQCLPPTGRLIRLRVLDAPSLLRHGKIPDILTPLVVRSVYQELTDDEMRAFLGQPRVNIDDALAMLDTMEFVCKHSIADETPIEELTLAEKRWIFRLVMGPAEILTNFRYDPTLDVEYVDEVQELQPTTESVA